MIGGFFLVAGILAGIAAIAGAKLAGLDAVDFAGLGVLFLGIAIVAGWAGYGPDVRRS